MAERIFKTVYKVTILSDEEISPHMELPDVLREATDGAYIGDVEISSVSVVPTEKVHEELLAIGNDGTFFGADDDDEEAA